ncbi:MAG: SRPBCC family protein [Micromonosporaceae bacterium]|nr:SRPBCC family protein [Micromonosporaceae bacterium]
MRLSVGTDIAAPVDKVYAVYADYRRWPEIFPTIHGVRVMEGDERDLTLAIDHVEGMVRNRMILRPPGQIVLEENKRAYDATFINTFRPSGAGTRFVVDGHIRLKGIRRLLAPIVRPYARRLMRRFQLAPVKAAAERGFAADPSRWENGSRE